MNLQDFTQSPEFLISLPLDEKHIDSHSAPRLFEMTACKSCTYTVFPYRRINHSLGPAPFLHLIICAALGRMLVIRKMNWLHLC